MNKFREDLDVARQLLLSAHEEGDIDDEELILFQTAFDEEEGEAEGKEKFFPNTTKVTMKESIINKDEKISKSRNIFTLSGADQSRSCIRIRQAGFVKTNLLNEMSTRH